MWVHKGHPVMLVHKGYREIRGQLDRKDNRGPKAQRETKATRVRKGQPVQLDQKAQLETREQKGKREPTASTASLFLATPQLATPQFPARIWANLRGSTSQYN